MANRKIIENGAGSVGYFPPITITDSGFTEQQAAWLSAAINAFASALNGNLSLGTGDHATRAGNLNAQWVSQYFPTKDVETEIPHGLGRRPVGVFFGIPNAACRFYTAKRGSWSNKTLWVACDADGITVDMIVF